MSTLKLHNYVILLNIYRILKERGAILYNIIKELCNNKGVSVSTLAKDLKISPSLFTELKTGRTKSLSSDRILLIADYFQVSTDYLLGKTDIKENPPTKQAEEFEEAIIFRRDGKTSVVRISKEKSELIEKLTRELLDQETPDI